MFQKEKPKVISEKTKLAIKIFNNLDAKRLTSPENGNVACLCIYTSDAFAWDIANFWVTYIGREKMDGRILIADPVAFRNKNFIEIPKGVNVSVELMAASDIMLRQISGYIIDSASHADVINKVLSERKDDGIYMIKIDNAVIKNTKKMYGNAEVYTMNPRNTGLEMDVSDPGVSGLRTETVRIPDRPPINIPEEKVDEKPIMPPAYTFEPDTEKETNLPLSDLYDDKLIAFSYIGKREAQEDRADIIHAENLELLAVCDGMGGIKGGRRASDRAIETIREAAQVSSTDVVTFLKATLRMADRDVHALLDEEGNRLDAGTTVTIAALKNNDLYWVSTGDSRIYIKRGKAFLQVTKDQTYGEFLKDQLEKGAISEEEMQSKISKAAALTGYAGMGKLERFDISSSPLGLKEGDVIVVCSDGAWRFFDVPEFKGGFAKVKGAQEIDGYIRNFATDHPEYIQDNLTYIIKEI